MSNHRKGINIPCRECGAAAGIKREGDYSMCAACGGNRHRYKLTSELSEAIDAHYYGKSGADKVVSESFNQDFKDITDQM